MMHGPERGRIHLCGLYLYLVLHLSTAAQIQGETLSHPVHSPERHSFQLPGSNGSQSLQETLL